MIQEISLMSMNVNISKFPFDLHNFQIVFPQYNSAVFKSIISLSGCDDYQDLVFICRENVHLKCNKIIVSCASNFIKQIIRDTGQDTVYVTLPDVKQSILNKTLKLIYEGFVDIINEEHVEFLETCALLGIILPDLPVTETVGLGTSISQSLSQNDRKKPIRNKINITETVWSFDSDRSGLKLYSQVYTNTQCRRGNGQRQRKSMSALSTKENIPPDNFTPNNVTNEIQGIDELSDTCPRTTIIPFSSEKLVPCSVRPPPEVIVEDNVSSTVTLDNLQDSHTAEDMTIQNDNTSVQQTDIPSNQETVKSRSITIIPFGSDTDIDKMRQDCLSPSFLALLTDNNSSRKLNNIESSSVVRDASMEMDVNDDVTLNSSNVELSVETNSNAELNTVISNTTSSTDTVLVDLTCQEVCNDSNNEYVRDSSEMNAESSLVSENVQKNIVTDDAQTVDSSYEPKRDTLTGCIQVSQPGVITQPPPDENVVTEDVEVCNVSEITTNNTSVTLNNSSESPAGSERLFGERQEVEHQTTENIIVCEEQTVVEVNKVTTESTTNLISRVRDNFKRFTQLSPVVQITRLRDSSYSEKNKEILTDDLETGDDKIIEILSDDDDEPCEKFPSKNEGTPHQNTNSELRGIEVMEASTSAHMSLTGHQNENVTSKDIKSEPKSDCMPSLVYKCNICGELSLSATRLKRHLTSHGGAVLKTRTGDEPELQENRAASRQSSNNESKEDKPELLRQGKLPGNINKHICMICKKQFLYERSLYSHYLSRHLKSGVHTPMNVVKQYRCNDCDKLFVSKHNLIRHLKNSHTGIKKFTCTVCMKSFTYSYNLSRHSNVHTGLNKCTCAICQKTFKDRYSLKRHYILHTGKKKYSCDTCQKCFSDSSSLSRHRSLHSGIKKYKCNFCNKSFIDKRYLTRHLNVHVGLRKYKCRFCNELFTNRTAFIQHRNIHTPDQKV